MPDKKPHRSGVTTLGDPETLSEHDYSGRKWPSKVDPETMDLETLIGALSAPGENLDGVKTIAPPFAVVPSRVARMPIINPTALKVLIIICSTCDRRGVSSIRATTIQRMIGLPVVKRGRKWGNIDHALCSLERLGIIRRFGEWPHNRFQVIYDPNVDPDEVLGKVSPKDASDVIADDDTLTALRVGTGQKSPKIGKEGQEYGGTLAENSGSGPASAPDPAAVEGARAANLRASIDRVTAFATVKCRRLWGMSPVWPTTDIHYIERLVQLVGQDDAIAKIDHKMGLFRRIYNRPPTSLEAMCEG